MDTTELLAQVDILDYISQYCEFTEKGGEYWALSPFKEERTPSFSVDPIKQFFYDFSSGQGGNVIDFIRLYNHVDFPEAFRILRKYAHITENQNNGEITRLNAAKIARKFRRQESAKKIATYKELPDDYMEKYEFRKDKLKMWADEGIGWKVMFDLGVRYDAFSDRIVYPIRNFDGSIISVCGRTCDPDFKAHDIRKYTHLVKIGTLDTLYGFSDNKDAILAAKEIVLFEGAKSVMLAKTWGINNTVAVLTSHLNVHQMKFLIKLGLRTVVAFDKDATPLKDEIIQKLEHYVPVEYVIDNGSLLDEKMSPVDKGFETWNRLYTARHKR